MDTTGTQTSQPFTIIVGIDYSELSRELMEQAVSVARAHRRVRMHVIHALPVPATIAQLGTVVEPDVTRDSERLKEHVEKILLRLSEEWSETPPLEELTTHIGLYGAADAITALAAEVEADLVVVGTHGRSGFKHLLLGSVAEATIRQAPCAVLVVRPRSVTNPELQIEPPCVRCVAVRQETGGRVFWCAQHREHHGRRHTYRLSSGASSHQSGLLFPL
jgi:nucleotide-binding universal stress UspA family protein